MAWGTEENVIRLGCRTFPIWCKFRMPKSFPRALLGLQRLREQSRESADLGDTSSRRPKRVISGALSHDSQWRRVLPSSLVIVCCSRRLISAARSEGAGHDRGDKGQGTDPRASRKQWSVCAGEGYRGPFAKGVLGGCRRLRGLLRRGLLNLLGNVHRTVSCNVRTHSSERARGGSIPAAL